MTIKALIFDFDGLVMDTEAPSFQAWQETYATYGGALSFDVFATWIGSPSSHPYDLLEQQIGRPVNHQEVRADAFRRLYERVNTQTALPGVEDYVYSAKRLGLKVGMASSSPADWVHGHLSRIGLIDQFDTIKTSDDVQRVKPDPELFLAALDALNVRADEAIVLEDSPNGVLAANRAGIFCVAIPNPLTRQLNLDHADLRLSSMADLPLEALLQQVETRKRTA